MAPAMYPALPTLFYIKKIIIFGKIQESIIIFVLPFNSKINLQKFITATPMDHNWCQFIFWCNFTKYFQIFVSVDLVPYGMRYSCCNCMYSRSSWRNLKKKNSKNISFLVKISTIPSKNPNLFFLSLWRSGFCVYCRFNFIKCWAYSRRGFESVGEDSKNVESFHTA